MPQLQHNMWVTNAKEAALSVITGGGKWVEITVAADCLYQHLLLTAEKKFWRCVERGELSDGRILRHSIGLDSTATVLCCALHQRPNLRQTVVRLWNSQETAGVRCVEFGRGPPEADVWKGGAVKGQARWGPIISRPTSYVDAFPGSIINEARSFSSRRSRSKYSIVWANPSLRAVDGEKLNNFFANVRSG